MTTSDLSLPEFLGAPNELPSSLLKKLDKDSNFQSLLEQLKKTFDPETVYGSVYNQELRPLVRTLESQKREALNAYDSFQKDHVDELVKLEELAKKKEAAEKGLDQLQEGTNGFLEAYKGVTRSVREDFELVGLSTETATPEEYEKAYRKYYADQQKEKRADGTPTNPISPSEVDRLIQEKKAGASAFFAVRDDYFDHLKKINNKSDELEGITSEQDRINDKVTAAYNEQFRPKALALDATNKQIDDLNQRYEKVSDRGEVADLVTSLIEKDKKLTAGEKLQRKEQLATLNSRSDSEKDFLNKLGKDPELSVYAGSPVKDSPERSPQNKQFYIEIKTEGDQVYAHIRDTSFLDRGDHQIVNLTQSGGVLNLTEIPKGDKVVISAEKSVNIPIAIIGSKDKHCSFMHPGGMRDYYKNGKHKETIVTSNDHYANPAEVFTIKGEDNINKTRLEQAGEIGSMREKMLLARENAKHNKEMRAMQQAINTLDASFASADIDKVTALITPQMLEVARRKGVSEEQALKLIDEIRKYTEIVQETSEGKSRQLTTEVTNTEQPDYFKPSQTSVPLPPAGTRQGLGS